jgi:protein CpxP
MRKALWFPTLLLPALFLPALAAAQAAPGREAPAPVRVMVIENTPPTVSFDESLAQLQERLQVKPAQQAAWAGFVRSVDAYSRQFFAERPQSAYPDEPAPRQLERMNQRMAERMAALKQIEAQAKALYATLTPAQQKTADRYLLATLPSFGFLPLKP